VKALRWSIPRALCVVLVAILRRGARAAAVIARAAIAALLLAGTTAATDVVPTPPSGAYAAGMSALDVRLKRLEGELRCLVCQNETLAESAADLAGDLRREVRELALVGKSDDQIRAYLVARYGDFVLYDPPLKSTTWLLWLGPFTLLAAGGVLWWLILRRRERASAAAAGAVDRAAEARARARLEAEDDQVD
jgi:cytochrome c-type biogenesis protein CcmH